MQSHQVKKKKTRQNCQRQLITNTFFFLFHTIMNQTLKIIKKIDEHDEYLKNITKQNLKESTISSFENHLQHINRFSFPFQTPIYAPTQAPTPSHFIYCFMLGL